MRVYYLLAALALVGCTPRYTWQNPSVAPALADRQRQIDSAECGAIAMRAVPMPNVSMPADVSPPEPRNYRISGNTSTFGPGGTMYNSTFQGTATAAPAGTSYAEGVRQLAEADAMNAQAAQMRAAEKARDNLADACMMRRGWNKVRVTS